MITHDISLNKSDIQSLSTRESFLAFFSLLGYNTERYLVQTPAAMGFTAVGMIHEIRSIERIADEDGELQVYLIELKHLTVALTQALARALKNRAGNFFLVLTADYERLDFVLMEQVLPERARSGIGTPQVYLRPRVLSVDRRNPTEVELRVLRRFSYTEIDPLYQWDKLRSAYSVAEWSEPFFNNRALFSDYYLNERLPGLPEWQEDIRPAYQALQTLFSNVRQRHARQPEAALRRNLLEPIFQALGWRWKLEKPSEDKSSRPDYRLITSDGTEIPCLTYAWGRFLDGPDENRDTATPSENPGQTAVGVLDSLKGDGWVVVTNGKLWRLYSARAHSRATNFYEIDLEESLASPDPGQAFRYFWLFFRSAAFTLTYVPSPDEKGEQTKACFHDRLLDESASYAKALGERLKTRVFEQVFPHFAEGFIHYWRNTEEKGQFSDDDLGQVFQGTLTFLYRLLFLLYAEARDLLPVREVRDYFNVSLQQMKEEIAQKAGAVLEEAEAKLEKSYSADSTTLYDALTRLFRSVDRGDPALNVPVYNGGLFITFDGDLPSLTEDDPPELHNAVFLARHKIPDRFLALGLDRLVRDVDQKTFALVMIDYKSLGVRQLGSIYEGLLEFKVRIAAEKMAIISGKKGEEIVPYAQAQRQRLKIKASGRGSARKEQTIPKRTVYLTNDRRERKATGSYYTPDYIVKYIVLHTVGPVLEEKCEAMLPLIREAQQAYRRAVERQKAFQKQGMQGDDPEKVAHTYRHVVDALFDLRVLDPAMGSGHFLVETVDFITDRLLTFLSAFPWNPVIAALRQTRKTILEEIQRQNVNIDPARLTDVHLLKRQVLKRCIYGVDLNPMAVELAKVSMWLDCFTLGAPLSFLDHHLKCGNSLIGARIEEVRAALDMAAEKDRLEIPLLVGMMGSQFAGVMLATDLMRRVGELSDVTSAQVRESREEYHRASDALAPYKRILDVYTSRWFGNPDTKLTSPVLDFLRNPKTEAWLKNPADEQSRLESDEQELAEKAQNAVREKRFFHWELEFPEVFFGPSNTSTQLIVEKDDPGFEVVIGNPPYILTSAKDDTSNFEKQIQERRALEQSGHYETLWGRWDVFVPFVERAVRILKKGGYHGFIISNSIEIAPYASKLRNMVLDNCKLCELHYFSGFQVFEGVGVNPTVYILKRVSPTPEQIVYRFHHKSTNLTRTTPELIIQNTSEEIWNSSFTPALNKTNVATLKLGEICYISAGAQLQSDQERFRDDFTKDDLISPSPSEIHTHLYSEGKDLSRYNISEFNYVAYDVNIQKMKRPRFRELFENPKLMISLSGFATAQINQTEPFDDWVYCNHSIILALRWIQLTGIVNRSIVKYLPIKNRNSIREKYEKISNDYNILYLLALVNSKYLNSYTRSQLTRHKIFITEEAWRKTPIRRIYFATSTMRRKSLLDQVQMAWEVSDISEILSSVEERLSTKPEESDVVHDILAFLARQMIEMNILKQAETKRFLAWLEGTLQIRPGKDGSTGMDALTGKSHLRNYLGDYQKGEAELSFDELQDILFKNRTRLGISLNDARFTAKLRDEYEKSLAILLPIKEKVRHTDTLIDQIVFRLYGLTEEEIAIVEDRQSIPVEISSSQPSFLRGAATARPFSIARESNPEIFALILDLLHRQGPLTELQLSAYLTDRYIKLEPDRARNIRREMEFLQWLKPDETQWILTSRGQSIVEERITLQPDEFARRLCVDNDRFNQRVVSRLLERMWSLNEERQGAIILPRAALEYAPAGLKALHSWLENQSPRWEKGIRTQMKNLTGEIDHQDFAKRIIIGLRENWDPNSAERRRRLIEIIKERYLDWYFGHIMAPNDVEIWESRMDRAGLTHTARELPGVEGEVWFPVGAFRTERSPDFTPVQGLERPSTIQAGKPSEIYYRYTPLGLEFEHLFASLLFEGYRQQQTIERVEYVSLLAVRDWVCFRLRVSHDIFERTLQRIFPQALRGDIPYKMALEVDITSADRARLGSSRPIIVDNSPRYIISMRSTR